MDRYYDLLNRGVFDSTADSTASNLGVKYNLLTEEVKKLRAENIRLRDRLTIYERKDASSLAIIREQEKKFKEVYDDKTRIASQLDGKNEQIAALQTKIANLRASNKTYQELVASLEAQIDEKKNEIDALKKMNHNLADSNETLRKLAHKTEMKPLTIDDLLEKLQEPKPQPKPQPQPEPEPEMSEEDAKTLARFKELMGDVSGFSGPEIVQRFLGTCLVMALEEELDGEK